MTREEAIEEINKVFEPAFANYIITALTEGATESDKALQQEPCEDCVSREHLLSEIDKLMQSPWFKNGKDFYDDTLTHYGYVERKEAVEIVRDLCVKKEPPVTPKPTECVDTVSREAVIVGINAMLYEIRAKIAAKIGGNGSENDGLDKALAIIDEYIREGKDCTDCILNGTDACPRGAGRAVDAEVCEDFIGESEDKE